jgi:DNA-binding NtrC family response regulator
MHQQHHQRILVVDDEQAIADTLTIILRHAGYDAMACYDAGRALEACTALAPDLLISDVIMPGFTGIDLAILVQQRCPSTGILLISGLGISFDLMEEARRQGHHFEILEKPIHPTDLLREVAAALREGSSVQRLQRSLRTTSGSDASGGAMWTK